MSSAINASDAAVIRQHIGRVFGCTPTHFEQIYSGNSRVYKVQANDTSWVVKLYPSRKKDPRDRLGTEFGALSFLWDQGIINIPQPLHASPEQNLGIYAHVDGVRPNPQNISDNDIDVAITFLKSLKSLCGTPQSAQQPAASEACFSIDEYFISTQNRLKRLHDLSLQTPQHKQAKAFLNEKVTPLLHKVKEISQHIATRQKMKTDRPMPQAYRTLSPSDFGFHNTLRKANGQLVFVDFEYFGWDDPAKMIVDFLHHPAMQLSQRQKTHFLTHLTDCFNEDSTLSSRIQIAQMAFGLKWCLILLNEFLPDMLKRRIQANHTYTLEDRLNNQLQKAQDKYHDTLNQYHTLANAR